MGNGELAHPTVAERGCPLKERPCVNSRLGGLRVAGTLIAALAIATILPYVVYTQSTRDVVISEIAWMGTTASSNDEWIELSHPYVGNPCSQGRLQGRREVGCDPPTCGGGRGVSHREHTRASVGLPAYQHTRAKQRPLPVPAHLQRTGG